MVNTDDFLRRLEKILEYYGLSAAAFADKIGVQRSGISHLLAGRNKPSLEFVLRIIKTFPEVNLYWLLDGKGSFPTASQEEAEAKIAKPSGPGAGNKDIRKIIIFYSDGSFETYSENAGLK